MPRAFSCAPDSVRGRHHNDSQRIGTLHSVRTSSRWWMGRFRDGRRGRLPCILLCCSQRDMPVAQRIEHLTTDQKVRGSNPYRRTSEPKSVTDQRPANSSGVARAPVLRTTSWHLGCRYDQRTRLQIGLAAPTSSNSVQPRPNRIGHKPRRPVTAATGGTHSSADDGVLRQRTTALGDGSPDAQAGRTSGRAVSRIQAVEPSTRPRAPRLPPRADGPHPPRDGGVRTRQPCRP